MTSATSPLSSVPSPSATQKSIAIPRLGRRRTDAAAQSAVVIASTSSMSARSSRASTRNPALVTSTTAAASPAASPRSTVPSAPVTATVPSAASAGTRRAYSVGPRTAITVAASQYASGGLVRKGSPFMRGVTQSPVSTISRAGSANIPSVSEKPGRPSRQTNTPAASTSTRRSRRLMRPGTPPPRAGT